LRCCGCIATIFRGIALRNTNPIFMTQKRKPEDLAYLRAHRDFGKTVVAIRFGVGQ